MVESVVKLNEHSFRVGSSMVCEQSETAETSSILARWQDDGKTFILREATKDERKPPMSWLITKPVHYAGSCSGDWLFGKDTFCKGLSWLEGMEAEGDIINIVKTRCPNIPVPEVVFNWFDRDWNRSFLITKRIPGRTLDESWTSLSSSQQFGIAKKLAGYCSDLSKITSRRLESATGAHGVCDDHLNDHVPRDHASWKPRFLAPMSADDLSEYLRIRTSQDAQDIIPSVGDTFHFYHGCLSPIDIMVSEDAEITGILDWNYAAFYPKFWIALKPGISAGFFLDREFVGNDSAARWAYAELLHKALIAEGFEVPDTAAAWWRDFYKMRNSRNED